MLDDGRMDLKQTDRRVNHSPPSQRAGPIYNFVCKFVCLCADSSFVPPLVYAVLGSSRDIAIGPVAVVSLLLGTLLKQQFNPTKNPQAYLELALTATFFAGIFQTALGFLRYKSHTITCTLFEV